MYIGLKDSSIEGDVSGSVDDVIGVASSSFGGEGVAAANVEASVFCFV